MQRFRRLFGLSSYISDTFTYVSIVAGMFFSVLLVLAGYATMGEFLAMQPLANQVVNPAREIAQFALYVRAGKPAIRRVEAVLTGTEGEEECGTDVTEVLPVSFSHVRFSYEEGKEIVKDFSFQFESGEKYAIVGSSGSGKSTLLKLLMSYYDNYESTITYGGQEELRTLDKGSLYANAAMIQQRVVLFEDSIKDNITMYSKRTDEAVQRVADEVGLGALIAEEEEGIHGKVAENGQNFSGGEQQRFAIARAFIRNTPVMYLDEATASLDNQTSSQIENLLLSKKELTAVVVTHKLNAEILRRYDTVLVLKNGKIEESGSFDELMDRRKYFYGRYQVNQ